MDKEVWITLVLSFFLLAPPVFASSAEEIDITHHDLRIEVSPEEHRFDVSALVLLTALQDGITAIEFSFNDDLHVGEISSNGSDLEYTRSENHLTVLFDSPLRAGEEIGLKFEYFGIADVEPEVGESVWGYVGSVGSYMIYEASWYPMVWGDRATATIRMRAPEGLTGVSLGTLQSVSNGPGYSEFVYGVDTPTRGISFAAGEYRTKTVLFGHRPVTVYAYPDDIAGTELALKKSTDILDFYSAAFGEYPYSNLKIVEIPDFFMGGHGDQGMIMLYSNIFRKDTDYRFLAHEIAHNWWGAQVSAVGEHSLSSSEGFGIFSKTKKLAPREREEHSLWLLEGFSTYSSMMYKEHEGGTDEMLDYLDEAKGEYLSKIKTSSDEPIINAEEEYGRTGVFHAVVYSKGALVLHMLRYVVGDEKFLLIMNTYAKNYNGKSATVEDFQAVCEEVSGMGLAWFFDEWVRETTLPDYAIGDVKVTKNSPYEVSFNIYQKGDIAKMPLDVTLYTSKSALTKRVWIDSGTKQVSFTTSSKPVQIEIDKDNWVLERDRSNNRHVISYPSSIAGVKLLLAKIIGAFS